MPVPDAVRLATEGPGAATLIGAAAARLRAAGSDSPRLDAELLVGHAFGRDRAWLHAHPEAALDAAQAASLAGWLERRAAGEPIAYIRGFKEWYSLRVATDPRALIPRPETELLASTAIDEISARLARDDEPIRAWEVGTGSGALILAVALRFRTAAALARVRLAASDISPEALELAAENLASHRVAALVTLACGDLLDPLALPDGPVDLVVANLPYLTSDEAATGIGSLAWEPREALDGGPDGLELLRRLIARLPDRLAPSGVALLEIGAGQAAAVRAVAEALPIPVAVTVLPDLAGIDRVARIARR
jgi:release factor glutamine methyltransferase